MFGKHKPEYITYNIFTKMPAKDNRSSFQEYLQATFLEHKNNCTSQWACLNTLFISNIVRVLAQTSLSIHFKRSLNFLIVLILF